MCDVPVFHRFHRLHFTRMLTLPCAIAQRVKQLVASVTQSEIVSLSVFHQTKMWTRHSGRFAAQLLLSTMANDTYLNNVCIPSWDQHDWCLWQFPLSGGSCSLPCYFHALHTVGTMRAGKVATSLALHEELLCQCTQQRQLLQVKPSFTLGLWRKHKQTAGGKVAKNLS